mmetsp:Transcript_36821/g.90594  ORF Transcript_36821/g.90594 Transcript_36821/m.90594 type:complete len:270 (+) Transcript_36821:84-893(+)
MGDFELVSAQDASGDNGDEMGVAETYKAMYNIVQLPAVRSLTLMLMTSKIAFAAADSVTSLKMQERGVKKEEIAMLGVAVTPIALFLPAIIAKYTSGPNPLGLFMAAVPYRIVMGLFFAVALYSIPSGKDVSLSYLHYAMLFICFAIHQVFMNAMFVSQMAFFASVSDPLLGGTYMTLLNTIANLAAKWPSTLVLALVEPLTLPGVDGYYTLTAICTGVGVGWWLLMRGRVAALSDMPLAAWRVHPGRTTMFGAMSAEDQLWGAMEDAV